MDTISSAEFRKSYARLNRITVVTVNGHIIGKWTPIGRPILDGVIGIPTFIMPEYVKELRPTQAQRDAILRKINKGG